MLMKTALLTLMGLAIAAEASTVHRSPFRLAQRQSRGSNGGNRGGGKGGSSGNNNANSASNSGATQTCLAANAVQTGSESTGQNGTDIQPGQVNSAT